jgi:RNA 2',3'-cyclic 3'-phosphodiesterase
MRLFVAVWPDEATRRALSVIAPDPSVVGLRWVPPANWHVTLAFLGSVSQGASQEIAEALSSVGSTVSPTTAVLGPRTRLLGRSVLCAPVDGLEELATAVRAVTDLFIEPKDRAPGFFGHLTLARSTRGRSVPGGAAGASVAASWAVREIRLVASTPAPGGSHYAARAVVAMLV